MATSHAVSSRKAAAPTAVDGDHDVLLHELAGLRRSEAVLRDFIETSTIGLHWVGADGSILWANKAELDLLGYTQEEYVGRNIAEFHADESVIKEMLARLGRGETLRDHPARMRHRDGSIRHVLVNSSVLFEDGKFVHTRCFTRDVTALREEQVTNLLLATIVDSSDDAIISEDLTGRITSWNRGAERIFGYTAQEAIGQSIMMLIPEDRQQEEVEILARLQRGDPVDHLETLRRRKNGELVNISLTISPVRDRQGRIIGGSKIARDITEVKHAREEALARQKLESVGTLASGIAHDFNNLLGGVQAQAELALADLDASSSAKEALKGICELAKRGSEIVRQLMIYAGKESDVVEHVDLWKIVEEMLALLKVSVSKHALIIADLERDLPAIPASPAQLRQIVMNLVTNASDAIGDRDGVIRVITRHGTRLEKSATDAELSEGDYAVLEVSDTGCGMSRETQERLFDPFFTTKSAGRGLGLAVVSGIVRRLGGAIRLTSELGKGSTFQILLPGAKSAAATSYAMSSIEELADPARQATVLIVEDEEVLRGAVAKTLRKNSFEVFEAANGSFAIDLLRAKRGTIDLVLLDMTIPGASSYEVVAEATQTRPDIKVVLTSAYSQEMLRSLMNKSKIHGFIRKPFQLADLVKTLRHSLVS